MHLYIIVLDVIVNDVMMDWIQYTHFLGYDRVF